MFLIGLSYCNKSSRETIALPGVTTQTISGITNTAAVSGGNITGQGSTAVIARGVCWNTSSNPTISGSHTTDSLGIGSFASNITGLTANTGYYVRAYASNANGTAYGNEVTFTTSNTTTAIVDTVYISGTEANRARVWVNGTGTALSSNQSSATYVFVQNNDVYVAGLDNNAGVSVPVYWKNGTANSLPHTGNICLPYGIAVNGSDVYVVGYEYLSGVTSRAQLWKNSIVTNLPSNGNSAQAWSVAVSGTDVYVGGLETDATSSTDYPILWKNGVRQILPTGGVRGGAYSVFVAGVDVYVCGFTGDPGNLQPVYWKNAVMQVLPAGPGVALAFSIFVSGTDVYVAGKDNNFATIWKNGIATHLTDGSLDAEANNVSVKGDNVYVVGREQLNVGGNAIIKLWKNGTPTALTDGSAVAWVYGLYVK